MANMENNVGNSSASCVKTNLDFTDSKLRKYFDCIDVAPDGVFLLGTSNLTSRYWDGMLGIYQSAAEAQSSVQETSTSDAKQSVFGKFEAGIPSARFLGSSDKVVVGLDNGCLQLFIVEKPEERQKPGNWSLTCATSVWDHDAGILSLDVDLTGKTVLTGSYDLSIRVWDSHTLVCQHKYLPAHREAVVSLALNPHNSLVFTSCSEDGEVLIWDTRLDRPAHRLPVNNALGRPCSVAWKDEHEINYGTVQGQIGGIEMRHPGTPTYQVNSSLERPVRNLKHSPANRNHLAVSGDEGKVNVFTFEASKPVLRYTDERHMDYVKGLAWSKDSSILYSCGWDQRIIAHEILL